MSFMVPSAFLPYLTCHRTVQFPSDMFRSHFCLSGSVRLRFRRFFTCGSRAWVIAWAGASSQNDTNFNQEIRSHAIKSPLCQSVGFSNYILHVFYLQYLSHSHSRSFTFSNLTTSHFDVSRFPHFDFGSFAKPSSYHTVATSVAYHRFDFGRTSTFRFWWRIIGWTLFALLLHVRLRSSKCLRSELRSFFLS